MERGTKNRVFAIVVLVLTIAVNVYGMLTLPAITAVGGALTKGGEIVELPTLAAAGRLPALCAVHVHQADVRKAGRERRDVEDRQPHIAGAQRRAGIHCALRSKQAKQSAACRKMRQAAQALKKSAGRGFCRRFARQGLVLLNRENV